MEEERKEPDWFPNAKVYHNGSHYIGIPHTTNRRKQRPKPQEKVFVIREETDKETGEVAAKTATLLPKLELMDDDECPDCPFALHFQALSPRQCVAPAPCSRPPGEI